MVWVDPLANVARYRESILKYGIDMWGRQMQMTIPPPGTPEVENIEIVKTA